jgi:CrcB protein
MMKLLLIGLGGFVGTLFRYWITDLVSRRYGETFPMGTLLVNAIGCLLVGVFFYLLSDRILTNSTTRAVIFIGLLGGFTTFSSYGLQTFTLLRDGEMFLALVNVLASNILCVFLVWLGYTLARVI